MLKPRLLEKYGIIVPDGQKCEAVDIILPGGSTKTVTDGKKLQQQAKKVHGATLRPIFRPEDDTNTI